MAKNDHHTSRWTTRRDVAAFFVLVVTAAFTGLQWYEMRQALLVDQRAWVSVVGPPNFPLEGAFIPASIQIANTGKTPGKQLVGDVIATVLKKGEEPSFDFSKGHPHDRIHAGAIFPNTPFNVIIPVVRYGPQTKETIVPTLELRQEIANGESFIVFYGRITYVDIFGTSHWTSFCTETGSAMGDLKKCVSYNDVDTN
jgi:hypothetical protein